MTVFKKGNNKWYYRFQLNGKEYYRACKGAVDQKTALQYEAIVKAELKLTTIYVSDPDAYEAAEADFVSLLNDLSVPIKTTYNY